MGADSNGGDVAVPLPFAAVVVSACRSPKAAGGMLKES
jgi:hypothetical protein